MIVNEKALDALLRARGVDPEKFRKELEEFGEIDRKIELATSRAERLRRDATAAEAELAALIARKEALTGMLAEAEAEVEGS